VHVPALPLTGSVVDSTGAGDALVGGTAAALSAGQALGDAVHAGVEAAASVLSRRGASPHQQAPTGRGEATR
jgi:ribokinase